MEYITGPAIYDPEKDLYYSEVGELTPTGQKGKLLCSAYGNSKNQAERRSKFLASAFRVFKIDTLKINQAT